MTRISELPRRDWREDTDAAQDELTSLLKTPSGTFRLTPIQTMGLLEFAEHYGLFGAAAVGSGKTAMIGLGMRVVCAQRILIVAPASLLRSIENEFRKLRQHFKIPDVYQMRSYSWLSRDENCDYLMKFRPEVILADEIHKLKNHKKAAVARRFDRFFESPYGPNCKMMALSGSMMRAGARDFMHILWWCLRDNAPVPKTEGQREMWAAVLDDGNPRHLTEFSLSIGVECKTVEEAREAFNDRLDATPGVVISQDTFEEVELSIHPIEIEPADCMEAEWEALRTELVLPDGWDLADAQLEGWAKACEFALGFYNMCDPRPPDDWYQARKQWNNFTRKVIEDSDCYDSPVQVIQACENGDAAIEAWEKWRDIRDTFTPKVRPVWMSDHALKAAEEWGRARDGKNKHGGIIWVDHIAFGEKLSEMTGWAYFGEKGFDRKRRHIEDKDVKDKVVILSGKAGQEGMNLQFKWRANLFTQPMTAALDWEQRLARTHRKGQAHKVVAYYFVACTEHLNAIRKTLWLGASTEELMKQPTKVLRWKFDLPVKKKRPSWAFQHTVGETD